MFWPEVRFTKKERSSHPESPHGLSTHLCWAGSQQSRQSSLGVQETLEMWGPPKGCSRPGSQKGQAGPLAGGEEGR